MTQMRKNVFESKYCCCSYNPGIFFLPCSWLNFSWFQQVSIAFGKFVIKLHRGIEVFVEKW